MALFVIPVPILPGKTEQWHSFIGELKGSRFRDFQESRRRLGVHEQTFFQSTPQGDMVIVSLEGDNPAEAFQRFGNVDDDFTRWFLRQVKEIHGLDLRQPPQGAMPEMVLDSHAGGLRQS
ncbi:MAG: hypothetical protein ACYC3S_03545 [Chloroflexota bacterium]